MRERSPRRTSGSDWIANCHTQRRTSYPSCFRSRTSCSALRLPSRRQMAKYRDWTGQLIDANPDSSSKRTKCRTIKSVGPLQCGERPSNAASSGSSIRDRASHCARRRRRREHRLVQFRRERVELPTARPGGGDSSSKPSSDVRRNQIPRVRLANEGNRRDPKQSRIPGEQNLSRTDAFIRAE